MADDKKCKVIIKRASGDDCEIDIEKCCEGEDGTRVIVVKCDDKATDCCQEK